MSRLKDRELLALGAIVALGAALRFSTLPDRSYWIDEGQTVTLVRNSIGGLFRAWYYHRDTPPLYDVLTWLWSRPFGVGEAGLRSLSALIGTATIPVAWAATRRLASGRPALIAALIVAVNPLAVWFSQDARTYALVILTAGLSFLTFLDALEEPSRRRLRLWAGASALLVLSHYFGVFFVAAEAAWLLRVHGRNRRDLRLAAALPAVVFLAVVPFAITYRSSSSEGFIAGTSLPMRIVQLPAQYVVGYQPPAQVLVSVLAFLAIPVAVWVLVRRTGERERRGAVLAVSIGAVSVLAPMAMGLIPGVDYLLTRHTVAAFVPLAVVVGIALGSRRAGFIGVAALAWLCAFSVGVDVVTADHSKFDHEDWRGALRAFGKAPGPRALVMTPFKGAFSVVQFYLPTFKLFHVHAPRVVEIDLAAVPSEQRRIGQVPRPPRPPTPTPPRGFRLVLRKETSDYTVLRYRAQRPLPVTYRQLKQMRLTRRRALYGGFSTAPR